jgi:hypothetical protein
MCLQHLFSLKQRAAVALINNFSASDFLLHEALGGGCVSFDLAESEFAP